MATEIYTTPTTHLVHALDNLERDNVRTPSRPRPAVLVSRTIPESLKATGGLIARNRNGDILTTTPPDSATDDCFSSHASVGEGHLGGARVDNRSGPQGMKGRPVRPRGESDLGRPKNQVRIPDGTPGFAPIPESPSFTRSNLVSLVELLTGVLIPLPYLLASLAFPIKHKAVTRNALLLEDLKHFANHKNAYTSHPEHKFDPNFPLVEAGILAGLSLLLIGVVGRIRHTDVALDKRKGGAGTSSIANDFGTALKQPSVIRLTAIRAASIALPIYGALQLGGAKAALTLLMSISTGLSIRAQQAHGQVTVGMLIAGIKHRKFGAAWFALLILSDVFGYSTSLSHPHELFIGYVALALSTFVLPPPLPTFDFRGPRSSTSEKSTFTVPASPWTATPPATPQLSDPGTVSQLVNSSVDSTITIIAGLVTVASSLVLGLFMKSAVPLTRGSILLAGLSLLSTVALVLFAQPSALNTPGRFGVLAGCAVVTLFGCTYISSSPLIPLVYSIWSATAYVALLFDTMHSTQKAALKEDDHKHQEHHHHHAHSEHSRFTGFLLARLDCGSVLHSILSEKDSRRIAYFASLNLAFMVVQFTYGFLTGSLGLLTDSIHMLFDCAGLAVGLAAAVMSKWPPSVNFPYGYGKIDTLSGFANGIFLMLVCVEIVFDALHRLAEGSELHRLNELLVVSTLGLLVNVVGLFATGHAHHGHGDDEHHGDSHNHDHGHARTDSSTSNGELISHHHHHSHSHDRSDSYTDKASMAFSQTFTCPPTPYSIPPTPKHDDDMAPSHAHSSTHSRAHSHSHHHNENMHGIFLHILADTLGSVAVIVSTLLTKWNGWIGWDPLASMIISVLIFASALPLVKNSARKLLLGLPDGVAYGLKEVLLGLGEVRGVVGYAGVRFWVRDSAAPSTAGELQQNKGITGVIHVIASRAADLDDVRERAETYLRSKNVDAVIQVEREGSGKCWCGGGVKTGG